MNIPSYFFLCETRLKSHEMELVKRKLNFPNMLTVSCVGDGRKRSGGLALMWQDNLKISLQSLSINHIDVLVESEANEGWRFTGLYGHPKDEHKYKTGELLERLAEVIVGPWVCGGDFNLMLMSEEKSGGGDFDTHHAEIFRRAVTKCGFQ